MKIRTPLPILTALLLLLGACFEDNDTVIGKYHAQDTTIEVILTLNRNGQGTWSTESDEISFKWSSGKNGRLWLHTKKGGVIRGTALNGNIKLNLPGIETIDFTIEEPE